MNKKKLYDVYVSYPPNVDRERINSCLYDNLPENQADDLVRALAERPQAIIAENCTQDERENAQHYFNYLGLDVIVRQSLELAPTATEEDSGENEPSGEITQCPVCMTIVDDPTLPACKTCEFQFATDSPQTIERKRIEWQEKLAFEYKKQTEIAHKLEQDKEREEKRLRKQIRAELEENLQKELGAHPILMFLIRNQKKIVFGIGAFLLMIILVLAGYLAAKYL